MVTTILPSKQAYLAPSNDKISLCAIEYLRCMYIWDMQVYCQRRKYCIFGTIRHFLVKGANPTFKVKMKKIHAKGTLGVLAASQRKWTEWKYVFSTMCGEIKESALWELFGLMWPYVNDHIFSWDQLTPLVYRHWPSDPRSMTEFLLWDRRLWYLRENFVNVIEAETCIYH